jgi:prepilin-type N-terminal cleavage/methylation domain-containing protein
MLKRIFLVRKFGFTLLELIVTCSIVAILAVISIPVYTKYRIRAKVATMVQAASGAQFAVSNDFFNQGYTLVNTTFPANTQPYLVPHSNFISTIDVEQGWVRVIGNPDYLGGRQINLVFEPTVKNNNITWTCYVSSEYFEYAPANCRNQGCAVYSWGPWQSVDQGTTWMYNVDPTDAMSTWENYCSSYSWYFGCTCYNATNTNLVRYQFIQTIVSNVNNGWGWTYLIVNDDCQESTMTLSSQGSCSSCPSGSVCQDMFTSLNTSLSQ